GGRGEPHLAVLAADGDQHLLARRLLVADRGLELGVALHARALGLRAAFEADVSGGHRRGFAEGEVDDVPAVRDVGQAGVAGAVGEAGVQVSDQGVRREVGRAAAGAGIGGGGGDGGRTGGLARLVDGGDLASEGGGGRQSGDGGGGAVPGADPGAVAVDRVARGCGDRSTDQGDVGGGDRAGRKSG